MRLCSFSHVGVNRFGIELADGQLLDLPQAGRVLAGKGALSDPGDGLLDKLDLKGWLSAGKKGIEVAGQIQRLAEEDSQGLEQSLCRREDVTWLPPITNPPKIIAIGLNYKDHAQEQKVPLPENPLVFAKFSNTLMGHEGEIKLPAISQKVDPEAELCVVILGSARQVSREQAPDVIAGYAVGNDVSARDIQFSDGQWVRGKSCDTFAPCGPMLVTPDEVGNPHELDIQLRLNGQVQQSSNTRNLIFDCYTLISFVSQAITLETGDIIFTGTPSGVGVFRDPPVFLKEGDVVEVSIEKIGTLKNAVISGNQ